MDDNRPSGHEAGFSSRSGNGRQAVEPEVLGPEGHKNSSSSSNGRAGYRNGFYGSGMGRAWVASGADASGCLAPGISIALFLVCLGQYGLLAAIGFSVFHLIGSIIGGVRTARHLVLGHPLNPWPWRLGNWVISFLLTTWLA